MGWTTTKLAAASSLGVIRLVLSLPGVGLAAVTGVPFLSGAVLFPIVAIMFAITPLIIRQVGSASVMAFVFSFLVLPLPLYGPPGLFLKIVVGVVYGVIADIVYIMLSRWERLSAIFVGAVVNGLAPMINFGMWSLLGVPGVAETSRVFMEPVYIFAAVMISAPFGYVAWIIYNRIRNTAIVKRIQH